MNCIDNIYHKFFTDSRRNYEPTAEHWYERHEDISCEHLFYTSLTSYVIGVIMNLHNALMSSNTYKPLKALGCIALSTGSLATIAIAIIEGIARSTISIFILHLAAFSSLIRGDFLILANGARIFASFNAGPILTTYFAAHTFVRILTDNQTLDCADTPAFTLCPSDLAMTIIGVLPVGYPPAFQGILSERRPLPPPHIQGAAPFCGQGHRLGEGNQPFF